MTNILIGVGGTGAKIVEAVLVMAAAGLGPKSLHVGLVDQDNSNGNVARTKTLFNAYVDARAHFSNPSGLSHVVWNAEENSSESLGLCKTAISELFGKSIIWCPGGDQTTLRNTVGLNLDENQKALFDLLFMPGEEEQDLSLSEGYRGRAHVGAAALVSHLTDPTNPLTANLSELMAGSGGREQVNIFIAGSAFGGTGAAGFPTIARELHRIRSSREFTNKGQVAIGGALMLPYFGFTPPEPDEKNLVVTTDELMPKAQMALEYYGTLFETEKAFDRFYLVGWDKFFNLGYHEAGNLEQRNPPLLPELFAAAAALTFLNGGSELLTPSTSGDLIKISARADHQVRWEDLPITQAKEKLGQLLRFAVYWRFVVRQLIDERRPWLGKANWTQVLSEKANKEEALQAIDALDALVEKILTFAATMEESAGDDWGVGPWRLGSAGDAAHTPTPTDRIKVMAWHPDGPEIFSDLIRNSDGSRLQRDAAAVYDQLETDPQLAAGGHKGYGKVVAAAFKASRTDTKDFSDAV